MGSYALVYNHLQGLGIAKRGLRELRKTCAHQLDFYARTVL